MTANTPAPSSRRRAITAATVGNILDWYDWGVYGFFTPFFAPLFFPTGSAATAVMLSFATFAVGFLMRPLGAIICGHLGDKYGRRDVLAGTIIVMGLGALVIGVLPPYAVIGLAAPIILLIARLVQGLATGGEFGGSSAFMVEFAGRNRRGFAGGMVAVGIALGYLLASLMATVLTRVLDDSQITAWGWRVPFLAGALLAILGIYLRLKVTETPIFQRIEDRQRQARSAVIESARSHYKKMILTITMCLNGTVAFYLWIVYMPTYGAQTTGTPASAALLANTIAIALLTFMLLGVGILSDRIGRKPLMITSGVGFFVLAFPLLLLIGHGGFWAILVTSVIGMALLAPYLGVQSAVLAELFPANVRFSGISIPFNISVALFGGTAPVVASYLGGVLASVWAFGLYMMVCALISTVAYMIAPETRHRTLVEAPVQASATTKEDA